ncbi:hypothetical protein DL96DRAFT_1568222 [Flagelloscypha sp. PMI_526]|nr:hypothetical protein DL96DRAFT_1568222 [Flagelloscypha sp. PMI_526]
MSKTFPDLAFAFMFLLLLFLLLSLSLSTSFVRAKTQYYIDDTNSTAWSFTGISSNITEPKPYNGSYTPLGSSVDIFGVAFIVDPSVQCATDFTWPLGNSTHVMNQSLKQPYNISYLHAEGFDPREVSFVSFVSRSCGALFDYAVVTVEDVADPSPSSGSNPLSPPMFISSLFLQHATEFFFNSAPIVGGVVGGLIILLLFLVVIWIKCRRVEIKAPKQVTPPKLTFALEAPLSEEIPNRIMNLPSSNSSLAVYEDQAMASASAPANSLTHVAREKQRTTGPRAHEQERPISLTSSNPAVLARVAQLQAEIHEIQSRDALPPPY